MNISLFLLVILALLATYTNGLKCYTCSIGENDFDQRCVTDPANVEIGSPITNCNKKYCTSMRQEYLDPKGKVASMVRGCEDKPVFLNTIIEDGSYRYYYRACQEELCNNGTGYSTGNVLNQDQDIGSTIYTKGLGGAITIQLNLLLLFIALVLYYWF